MITVYCDCGKAYRAKDSQKGKTIKCKECGNTIRIPGEPSDTDEKKQKKAGKKQQKKKKKKETGKKRKKKQKKKKQQKKKKKKKEEETKDRQPETDQEEPDRSKKEKTRKLAEEKPVATGDTTGIQEVEEGDTTPQPEELGKSEDEETDKEPLTSGKKKRGTSSSVRDRSGTDTDTGKTDTETSGSGSRSYRDMQDRKKDLPGLSILIGMLAYPDALFLALLAAVSLFAARGGEEYVNAFWKGTEQFVTVTRSNLARNSTESSEKDGEAEKSTKSKQSESSADETDQSGEKKENTKPFIPNNLQDKDAGDESEGNNGETTKEENTNEQPEDEKSEDGESDDGTTEQIEEPDQSGDDTGGDEETDTTETSNDGESKGFLQTLKKPGILSGVGYFAAFLALLKFICNFFFMLRNSFGKSGLTWGSLLEIFLLGYFLLLGAPGIAWLVAFLVLNVITFCYLLFLFDNTVLKGVTERDQTAATRSDRKNRFSRR